uniref:Uncharacterized protein n=1 Tax=Compsopogon caeruleus TaxID=31354 RepID=A0A7S1TFC7_9RHOD
MDLVVVTLGDVQNGDVVSVPSSAVRRIDLVGAGQLGNGEDGTNPDVRITCVAALESSKDWQTASVSPRRSWVLVGMSSGMIFLVDTASEVVIARFAKESRNGIVREENNILQESESGNQNHSSSVPVNWEECSRIETIPGTTYFITCQGGTTLIWDWSLSHDLKFPIGTSAVGIPSPEPGFFQQVKPGNSPDYVGALYRSNPVLTVANLASEGISVVTVKETLSGVVRVILGYRNGSAQVVSIVLGGWREAPQIQWTANSAIDFGAILCACWLADDVIAVGGEDDAVHLLSLIHTDRKKKITLRGHSSFVTDVIRLDLPKVSLISCGLDGRVLRWSTSEGDDWLASEWSSEEIISEGEFFQSLLVDFDFENTRSAFLVTSYDTSGQCVIRRMEIATA